MYDSQNNVDLYVFTKSYKTDYPNISPVQKLLRKEEIIRSERFVNASDKFIYTTSHAFLNSILCKETGNFPDELPLKIGEFGRPFLLHKNLFFSLSHSKNSWVVAISRHCHIGADIEEIKKDINLEGLLENYFTQNEQIEINSSSNPKQEFYRIWTRKEAVLKALGTGLNYKLKEIETCSAPLEYKNNQPQQNFVIQTFFKENSYISLASRLPFSTTILDITNSTFFR